NAAGVAHQLRSPRGIPSQGDAAATVTCQTRARQRRALERARGSGRRGPYRLSSSAGPAVSAWAGVAVAVTLGGYALVSARLYRSTVSGPMVFVAAGVVLGPLGLGLLTLGKDAEPVKVLFEATLALVLFTDALSVQSQALRRDGFLPIRLLAVGLPLTIALGWLFAWLLLPGLNIWEMALLGAILAPTDAALGQSA